MTPWAQLALIGTNHLLTTNAWVGKTLSGRDCCNRSAPNYQKGHLWISPTPLPWLLRVFVHLMIFPSQKLPSMRRYFLSIEDETQLRKSPLDVKILLSVWWYSVYKCPFGCGETFCPLRWNPVYKVSAGVAAVHLLPIPGTRQQQQCIRQQQCTADVKCGPFAAWDLSLDIRQQCFVFVLTQQGCIFRLTCSHSELTKDHVLTSA